MDDKVKIYQQMNLLGEEYEEEQVSDKYTKKINIPQYTPTMARPPLTRECYDLTKYKKLLDHINNSNVSEEEKTMLRYCACRHIVFNYSLIAELYAHASKEMQELMEESALVIIDIKDAIKNGYIKMSDNIKKIILETGKFASDNYHNQANSKRTRTND